MTQEPTSTAVSQCCSADVKRIRRNKKDFWCMGCDSPCDISEGKACTNIRAPKEVDTGEMGNTSATLPPVQSEEMESTSEKIVKDIMDRTMFARKEAWDNNNVWGTHYSADVQFLLSRLTASEARNKELEADKAKLLADCKKMKYWIMTEPCTCKMSSNRPCRACVLNNGFLSAFSYTDSPTAHG